MKKLLLIGVCLIVLSGFASALIDSTGFAPELDGAKGKTQVKAVDPTDPWLKDGAGSGVLEGAGAQTAEENISVEESIGW